MKHAVMIVMQRDDKFLLGKRASWKTKAPGYWCPISGHIELQESEEEAVIREAQEETGAIVKPVRKLTSISSHDKTVMLHWLLAEITSGEPHANNDENELVKWFSREELEMLTPVFKEDIDILLHLQS